MRTIINILISKIVKLKLRLIKWENKIHLKLVKKNNHFSNLI